MTSKLAQNSDSSNHNNIINYGEYLCEEKDFQLRRPYLSEMQLIEKLYTLVSLQKNFQVGDRGLLVKHPKRKGIQRFTVWEKDTYSVIKKR